MPRLRQGALQRVQAHCPRHHILRRARARRCRAGEPVDEFSSILDVHGHRGGFPVGAITLIALGVLLLLSTTDVIQLRYLLRYWPVLLILMGAYMLYVRVNASEGPIRPEVRHERQ